jgi:hypothetical protein
MNEENDQEFILHVDAGKDAPDTVFDAVSVLSSNASATIAIAKIQGRITSVPDDLTTMAELLKRRSRSKGTGEEMLKRQAITLDFLFNQLLQRAMGQSDFYVSEQQLRLAFKAQAQSRAALTAISDIRHPRVTNNIGQVNNATGHQQVNNDSRACDSIEEKVDSKKAPNKLTEDSVSDVLQNPGTSTGSEGEDQSVAAVEKVHRPKDSGG